MTDFDLESIMAKEGYISGIPAWGLTEKYDDDVELCSNSTCQICNNKGLVIRPFLDWSTLSYKAFNECPHCGTIKEI